MTPMRPADLQQTFHNRTCPSLGLYIHIPFCRVRCRFCAFYVQIHQNFKVRQFLTAIDNELAVYAHDVGLGCTPVSTVYFGGGTPTTLTARQLVGLLALIKDRFRVESNAEVSVEAHPGTATCEDLRRLREGGFNRLSLGVQSFEEAELVQLGGRTFKDSTAVTVEEAREAGFENISLDLMYGFPGQTLTSWCRTLEATVALEPTHLSCYAFTLEEGTHFHREVSQGRATESDEELQILLEETAARQLSAAGFDRYEISNFSRPGYACLHNLRYWQGDAYLGLGPSAQSFVGDVRFGNAADMDFYCHALADQELPLDHFECLVDEQTARERIVFGLRMMAGVHVEDLRHQIGNHAEWDHCLVRLQEQGLVTEEKGYLKLTEIGCRFSDTVAVALL